MESLSSLDGVVLQVLQHLLDAAPELADAVDASEAPLHRTWPMWFFLRLFKLF